jgi:hypothetical protein
MNEDYNPRFGYLDLEEIEPIFDPHCLVDEEAARSHLGVMVIVLLLTMWANEC